jgi:hypothetical protein
MGRGFVGKREIVGARGNKLLTSVKSYGRIAPMFDYSLPRNGLVGERFKMDYAKWVENERKWPHFCAECGQSMDTPEEWAQWHDTGRCDTCEKEVSA